MFILDLLPLLFCIVYCSENILKIKINITPYGEKFYYLTYRVKFEGLHFWKVFLSLRNYVTDFRFSENNGNMMCKCIWDGL